MSFRFRMIPWLGIVLLLAACAQAPEPSALNRFEPTTHDVTRRALEGALYEQTDNLTSIYAAGGSTRNIYAADDFSVPTGERWTIEEVGVLTSTVIERFNFSEYTVAFLGTDEDDPNLPGPLIAERAFTHADTSVNDGMRTIPLSEPVVLVAGAYWMGVDGYFVRLRTPPTDQQAARGGVGSFAPLVSGFTTAPVDLAFALFGTSETIVDFAALVAAFDAFVADRTLLGSGPGRSASGRLQALRNMLFEAEALHSDGDATAACVHLADAAARLHVDGRVRSDHFATGASASALREMILALRDGACP